MDRETDDLPAYVQAGDGKIRMGTLKELRAQAWNWMLRSDSGAQMIALLGEALAEMEDRYIRLKQELK